MEFTFDEKTLRLAVRALIKNKILKESVGDQALLDANTDIGTVDSLAPATEADISTSSTAATSPVRDVNAERRLKIMVSEAALDFEKNIVAQLGLVDPKDLDPESQENYVKVMEEMGLKMQQAVMDAVLQLKTMPKQSEDD
jgi:hypothetical protein